MNDHLNVYDPAHCDGEDYLPRAGKVSVHSFGCFELAFDLLADRAMSDPLFGVSHLLQLVPELFPGNLRRE